MRFQALACDYDGTLATDDRIGEQTLAALERARGAGLRLILVTGRTFFELIRVCERLDLFDVVVAENGDVLYFATTGVMRDHAPRRRLAFSPSSTPPESPAGEFLLVSPDTGDARVQTFVAAPRMTSHVRHLRKYTEGQLPDGHCFFFRTPDGRLAATAGSLGGFLHAVSRVGEEVLRFHATRGDFSRWLLGVFADRELGRQLAKIERRWGRDEIHDLRHAIERLIAAAMRRAEGRDGGIRDGR